MGFREVGFGFSFRNYSVKLPHEHSCPAGSGEPSRSAGRDDVPPRTPAHWPGRAPPSDGRSSPGPHAGPAVPEAPRTSEPDLSLCPHGAVRASGEKPKGRLERSPSWGRRGSTSRQNARVPLAPCKCAARAASSSPSRALVTGQGHRPRAGPLWGVSRLRPHPHKTPRPLLRQSRPLRAPGAGPQPSSVQPKPGAEDGRALGPRAPSWRPAG